MAKPNKGVEFSLFAPYNEDVVLLGEWNKRDPIPMTRGSDGWWRVSVPLEDGRFCVGLEFQKRLQFRDLMQFAKP